MPREYTPEEQRIYEARYGPGREAMAKRLLEVKELEQRGDPAFQPGSRFSESGFGRQVRSLLGSIDVSDDDSGNLDPTGAGGGGGYTLTFAQTEAGVRLAGALGLDVDRAAGREQDKLQAYLHSLAMEMLPPEDVETAMRQVRSGRVVKSKLAFQAVLQNLGDEAAHAERRADLDLAEENERRTLREARSRITIDLVGKDLGRALLFELSGATGG